MQEIEKLITCLARMPGIGRRSAERIAYKLVREPDKLIAPLVEALTAALGNICCCSLCGNITARNADPCRLCSDGSRDQGVICVVEDPTDIIMLEKSGGYRGRYHALMGKLSPMQASGPGDIRLKSLIQRIDDDGITEVILALSTDVEGDATASYLEHALGKKKVKVSRLAFGLPAGSGISYSDPLTLARAINNRK